MFVCLCVCPRGYLWNHMRSLPNFMCMLPVSVARSSSSMFTIGRIACRREGVFFPIENALPAGKGGWECTARAKYAMYDCLVFALCSCLCPTVAFWMSTNSCVLVVGERAHCWCCMCLLMCRSRWRPEAVDVKTDRLASRHVTGHWCCCGRCVCCDWLHYLQSDQWPVKKTIVLGQWWANCGVWSACEFDVAIKGHVKNAQKMAHRASVFHILESLLTLWLILFMVVVIYFYHTMLC